MKSRPASDRALGSARTLFHAPVERASVPVGADARIAVVRPLWRPARDGVAGAVGREAARVAELRGRRRPRPRRRVARRRFEAHHERRHRVAPTARGAPQRPAPLPGPLSRALPVGGSWYGPPVGLLSFPAVGVRSFACFVVAPDFVAPFPALGAAVWLGLGSFASASRTSAWRTPETWTPRTTAGETNAHRRVVTTVSFRVPAPMAPQRRPGAHPLRSIARGRFTPAQP